MSSPQALGAATKAHLLREDQASSERCVRCGALNVYASRAVRLLYRACFRCGTPLRSPWELHGALTPVTGTPARPRIRVLWARLRRFDTGDGALDCTEALRARCDGWSGAAVVVGVTEDVREFCGGDPAPGVPKVFEARLVVAGGRELTRSCRLAGDARLAEPMAVYSSYWRQDRDGTGTADRTAEQRIRVVAASVGDPSNPAGAADVTALIQGRIDSLGHGTTLLLRDGEDVSEWLPNPAPGKLKSLKVRFQCWSRDLETSADLTGGAAAFRSAERGGAGPQAGTGAAGAREGTSPTSSVDGRAGSKQLGPLEKRFPDSVFFDAGIGEPARRAPGAAPGRAQCAEEARDRAPLRLCGQLRIASPRLRPRLRVVSASWGHPMQPSGAYDVTPRLAAIPFELCGLDLKPPARDAVKQVPHPADEDVDMCEDPAAAADPTWTASLSRGEWVAGGASAGEARADWLSLPPEVDLHELLGDPFRTLGKVLDVRVELEPRPAAARVVVRQGRLLRPLEVRSPVLAPALQVQAAAFESGIPGQKAVDVSATLRQLIELQGGFQLQIGSTDSVLRLLGTESARPPPTADAPASGIGRSSATQPETASSCSPGVLLRGAATSAQIDGPKRFGLVSLKATPIGRQAGQQRAMRGGHSALAAAGARRMQAHPLAAGKPTKLTARPARQVMADAGARTSGDAKPPPTAAASGPRFVSRWRGEFDTAQADTATASYFGLASSAGGVSLPAEYGRTGALVATPLAVSRGNWGDAGLARLRSINPHGEEAAVARRLMGASGSGAGRWHVLRLELLAGQRRVRVAQVIPLRGECFGRDGDATTGLLPDGLSAGALAIHSDAAIGTGGDAALRFTKATVTPEDGAAVLQAAVAHEGRASAPAWGQPVAVAAASAASPPPPPPSLVDISRRLRSACRMTRDGLALVLPTGFDLERATGPLPFSGRDRALEVHWTTPRVTGRLRIPNLTPGPICVHVRVGWPSTQERLRSERMSRSRLPECPGTTMAVARSGPDSSGAVFLPLAAQSVMADGIVAAE